MKTTWSLRKKQIDKIKTFTLAEERPKIIRAIIFWTWVRVRKIPFKKTKLPRSKLRVMSMKSIWTLSKPNSNI
jgi:hypothetical protein